MTIVLLLNLSPVPEDNPRHHFAHFETLLDHNAAQCILGDRFARHNLPRARNVEQKIKNVISYIFDFSTARILGELRISLIPDSTEHRILDHKHFYEVLCCLNLDARLKYS